MSSVAPPTLGAKEPISKTVSFGDRVLDSKVLPYMRSRNIEFIAKRMRPLTQVFPFFNGVDVSKFVIPKLIEIRMTSGVFQVSETVVGSFDSPDLPKIKFRVAVQNHKYGNYDFPEDIFDVNPYNSDLKIPASYSSTSTILNIDTFSLSDRTSDFFGYIANGMKLRGSTSKAEAVITDIKLITNDDGVVIGSFFIPDPNIDVNPVFEAGIRPFRLTSSRNNSLVFGTYTTAAEENYNAEGKVNMVQENAIVTRPIRVETNITQVINVVGGPANPVSVPVDPGYIPTKDPGRSGNVTYTVPTPPPPPAPTPRPAPPPAPAPAPVSGAAPAPAPAPAASPSGLILVSKEGQSFFGSGAKNEPPTLILIDSSTNTQQNTDVTTLQNLAKEAGLPQNLQNLITPFMTQASLNLVTNELNKTSYMANASIRTTAAKNPNIFNEALGLNQVTRSISGSTGASVPITTSGQSAVLASSIKPLTSFAENLRTAQSNVSLSSPLLNSTLGISLGMQQASVAANLPSTAAPAPAPAPSPVAAAFNAFAGGSYRSAPAPAPSPPTFGQPANTPARPAPAPAPRPAPPPAPPPKPPFVPPPAPAPSKAPAPAPIRFGSGFGGGIAKPSDIRLKKNIVSINSALSKLTNITVVIK